MHKKYLASALLVLVTSVAAFSQERSWFVGLKGGFALPTISQTNETFIDNDRDIEQTLRYTGGLAVQYFVDKNFGLQVELNYAQRGWQQSFPASSGRGSDPNKSYEVFLNYLEVPILGHAYLGRKNLRLFLNGGVYIAYLYDNSIKQTNVNIEEDDVFVYDPRFQNKVDFGVRGGGGFEVVTAIGMFQVEGSFSWGINSIIDKDLAEIPNIVQNLSPAVTLGYYVAF